ncbi:MAG: DUF2945 domain-containing protein [Pseudobdellovibrio sp.]
MKFKIGDAVQWNWLGRQISGTVLKTFVSPTVVEIKNKKIKRNATAENPAYLVQSSAGNQALKLESELSVPESSKKSASKPKMFSVRNNSDAK